MNNYSILVCEDDKEIRESIGLYLKREGYSILYAENGLEALSVFKNHDIDLIIMDLMMPKLSGEDTILRIRETSYVPIIILSAKSQEFEKIVGLNIGADDYITKPFNPQELIARVNSQLRRNKKYLKGNENTIVIGDLRLDKNQKTIFLNNKKIPLTNIEYQILEFMMSNPNVVFSIDQIYEAVWNEPAIDPKTVTVHIRRIREKIEADPQHPIYLQVQWGMGYKFNNSLRNIDEKI